MKHKEGTSSVQKERVQFYLTVCEYVLSERASTVGQIDFKNDYSVILIMQFYGTEEDVMKQFNDLKRDKNLRKSYFLSLIFNLSGTVNLFLKIN